MQCSNNVHSDLPLRLERSTQKWRCSPTRMEQPSAWCICTCIHTDYIVCQREGCPSKTPAGRKTSPSLLCVDMYAARRYNKQTRSGVQSTASTLASAHHFLRRRVGRGLVQAAVSDREKEKETPYCIKRRKGTRS